MRQNDIRPSCTATILTMVLAPTEYRGEIGITVTVALFKVVLQYQVLVKIDYLWVIIQVRRRLAKTIAHNVQLKVCNSYPAWFLNFFFF